MGNLTRDPEHKQLSSGQSVCKLGLASNRQFKNRQTDTMVQEVCFVDIDVWGPQADSCNQYLQKGRNVLVEGRLKFDTWTDQEGQRRSKHVVVADRVTFLAGASDEQFTNQTEEKEPVAEKKEKAPLPANKPEVTLLRQGSEGPGEKPAVEKTEVPSTGEVKVTNDEPFEDDLPF